MGSRPNSERIRPSLVPISVGRGEADAELQAIREVKRYLASRRTQVDGTEERARDAQRARVSSL
jgi:hypothetical protein